MLVQSGTGTCNYVEVHGQFSAGRNVCLFTDTVNKSGSQPSALKVPTITLLAETSLANTEGLSKIFQY
jgi:hypothetical protein